MIINSRAFLCRKKFLFILFPVFLFLIRSSSIYGSESGIVNEDDLFSDSETVIEARELVDDSLTTETNKPSISLSGSIYNNNYHSTVRDDFILKNPFMENGDKYTGSITANLLLDMRYKDGIKGFLNTDTIYYFGGINDPGDSDRTYTDQALREIFIDFNIKKAVYLRVGRQYLKWGRNYFWNPTDLINIDKKDFLDPRKNLQGTKGIKIHTPFGTRYNIYGFIDLEDMGNRKDIAWAGKFEFITGDTEMSFSGWYKKGFKPIVGYDFSTRGFHIDWRGEISVSRGKDMQYLLNENAIDNPEEPPGVTSTREEGWIPRISFGFTKSFNFMDINDRINITGEFYYNHAGFDHNAFDEQDRVNSLLSEGLYVPNHISRYYASLFTSTKRFIVGNGILNLNYLSNLTDKSGIFYISYQYNFRYDFFLDLSFSQAIGNGKDEYTFSGNDKTFGLELRYYF